MATLGSQAVGTIVKMNVDGVSTNFIVVHQGLPGTMYDASCDGTWLLMQDIYEQRAWDSSDNDYAESDIHSYLNNTFVNLFDRNTKGVIKQVKIPYTEGDGTSGTLATGSSGLSAKVFLLSYAEVGFSGDNYAPVEGAVLSYFNGAADSKRVARLNGTATFWWLRSPSTRYTDCAWIVNSTGAADYGGVAFSNGVRPALVLPTDTNVADDGTIVLAAGAITGSVNIGGTLKELTGEGYVNIEGTLYPITLCKININGVLMEGTGQGSTQGLTFVDYIKSTGTQYIDTGYVATSENYRIKCSFYFDTIVNNTVPFGGGASTDIISALIRNSTIFHFYVGSGSVSATDVAITHGVNYDMECWVNNGTFTVILNGATYSGAYSGAINKEYPLAIFANNIAGSVTAFSSIRFSAFQIYDNDVLVRDFAPCINAEGEAGLYDKVNSKFYGNAGTGSFTTP